MLIKFFSSFVTQISQISQIFLFSPAEIAEIAEISSLIQIGYHSYSIVKSCFVLFGEWSPTSLLGIPLNLFRSVFEFHFFHILSFFCFAEIICLIRSIRCSFLFNSFNVWYAYLFYLYRGPSGSRTQMNLSREIYCTLMTLV